ncbi:MAG TPA: hypothetical protein VF469_01890, partial [Kofleriaceae bacterium]
MSHGGDLYMLSGGVPSEPNFDIAVRGYKKDQVDSYIHNLETENAALAAERDEAFAQLHALAAQVHQMQTELTELRRRGANSVPLEQISFRHLGAPIERIFAMAEDEAEAIKARALASIDHQRAEAERLLADAHKQHDQAVRDFEAALSVRRADEERAAAGRRAELNAEIAKGREYAGQIRSEADSVLTGARQEAEAVLGKARQEAQKIAEASAAHVEQTKAETEAYVAHHRTLVEQEAQQRRAAVEGELTALRNQADQYVNYTRGQAEQYAQHTRGQADEGARQQLESARAE